MITIQNPGLLRNLQMYFEKKSWDVWLVGALSLLFGTLLYEFKVSEGGDDSAYILRAYDLIHDGVFPSFQGPIYPFFLSIFMLAFGLNIQLFKILSLLCLAGFFMLGYAYLKKRLPTAALLPVFIGAAFSPMLMYFGSQTYSEAFFLMLFALFIGFFFQYFVDEDQSQLKPWHFVALGLWLWLLGNTRTISYALLPAVLMYLVSEKRWRNAAVTTGVFLGVYGIFTLLKRLIWPQTDSVFSSQGSTLLLKDPYAPTQGQEDLAGFVERFTGNADLYISKHYMRFLGWKDMLDQDISSISTITVAILFAGALYMGWKNRYLRFLAFAVGCFMGLTFLAVQTRWDQARLVLPYLPFLSLVILSGLIIWLDKLKNQGLQMAYVALMAVFLLSAFSKSREPIEKNQKEFKLALGGNVLAGYTPDWQNYIKMSEYAAEFAPDSVMIASRKAGISFIYGKRRFRGVNKIPFTYPDSLSTPVNGWLIVPGDKFEATKAKTGLWEKHIKGVAFGEIDASNPKSKVPFYYVLEPEQRLEKVDSLFDFKTYTSLETLREGYSEFFIAEPDRLVNELKRDNVHYIIMASLRRNPLQKTEFTINTISRYLYYIQMKYPRGLIQLHTIGNSEPANLIQLNYRELQYN